MTNNEFSEFLNDRIQKTRQTLSVKAGEYSSTTDRLHNFKVAAKLEAHEQTPEQALWGMLKKHLVSIIDMIAATERGKCPTAALRNEKCGDSINYMILLEALFLERERNKKNIDVV